MKKFYVLLIGFLLLNNVASAQEFPGELATNLQGIIDDKISSTPLKGVAVNVILGDGSEWTGTSGIQSGSTPIDTSMLFDFGGQRHALLVATLLKMQEDGLLSLEDSIGKYLSGMNMFDTSLPIKRFFNHTSGIGEYWESANPYWGTVFSDRSRIWSFEEIIEYIPEGSDSPDPAYDVTNTNHLIMALLVEDITGNPVGDEIQSRVLTPLGLNGSVFPVAEFDESSLNGVWKYNNGNPDDHSGLSQEAYLSSRVSWLGKLRDNAHFTRAMHSGQILNAENTEFLYEATPGSFASYEYPREGIEMEFGNGVLLFLYDNMEVYGQTGNSLHNTASYHLPDSNITITIALNTFDSNQGLGELFDIVYEEVMYFIPSDTTSIFSKVYQNNFTIFPNPASNQLNIRLEEQVSGQVSIDIFDMTGRSVQTIDQSSSYSIDNTIRIPLGEELEEGYYLLKVATETAVTAKPFLLSR